MTLRTLCFAALAACLPTSHAHAACLQRDGIYRDETGAFKLRFRPYDKRVAGVGGSNLFELAEKAGKRRFTGWVVWNSGISRPNGTVGNGCPARDGTPAQMKACAFWEGVIYRVDEDATVRLLPREDEPAAHSLSLLLSDLGRTLRYSTVWKDWDDPAIPTDHFIRTGCAR